MQIATPARDAETVAPGPAFLDNEAPVANFQNTVAVPI
jgi:hypothetical protein